MARSKELEKIKKMYGEEFMHLCRELFPTILEEEGKLLQILRSSFAGNGKTLYDDIVKNGLEAEFKDYIYSKIDVETPEITITEEKTPYELLDEAGYVLTECTTEEEIQSYRRYYAPLEELCTFRGDRLDRCFVFWAVKKNAEEIERKDIPRREDEYGTSVMSIQFNKTGKCTVSIKNRYNHSVNNPDSTYGNDLDAIIPGLAQSFKTLLEERGVELQQENKERFEIPGYVVANDGKYYKYNMEVNGIYYCPGNIVIENGRVQQLEPEKQILLDYFVLDLEKKEIRVYDRFLTDSFTDGLRNIQNIEVVKNKEKRQKVVTIHLQEEKEPITIILDEDNQIIQYTNPLITQAGYAFLGYNKRLQQLDTPNLESVGGGFLMENEELTQLSLPVLKKAGRYFLECNKVLSQLDAPMLEEVGDDFLYQNRSLTKLDLKKLRKMGDNFLGANRLLSQLEVPNLEEIGDFCLARNFSLTRLRMNKLKKVGISFLTDNKNLSELYAPELETVGGGFLSCNLGLKQLNLPSLKKAGYAFLYSNRQLQEMYAPALKEVETEFLYYNEELRTLDLPSLTSLGYGFLCHNCSLQQLNLPMYRGKFEPLEGWKELQEVIRLRDVAKENAAKSEKGGKSTSKKDITPEDISTAVEETVKTSDIEEAKENMEEFAEQAHEVEQENK